MTVKTILECDRCKKPIGSFDPDEKRTVPTSWRFDARLSDNKRTNEDTNIKFDHMCTDCEESVNKYLKLIKYPKGQEPEVEVARTESD
jgi:hypothetical protein